MGIPTVRRLLSVSEAKVLKKIGPKGAKQKESRICGAINETSLLSVPNLGLSKTFTCKHLCFCVQKFWAEIVFPKFGNFGWMRNHLHMKVRSSRKLKNSFELSPIITLSTTSMPSTFPASISRSVTRTSSRLGVTSPLG